MDSIKVRNVSEFIKFITNIKSDHFYDNVAHLQVLYRGHSNSNWDILPAAFRNKDDYFNERLYLQEFQRVLPNEFVDLKYFDVLVKAQHYGIPTRLLDLTSNPLVALYFACEGNLNVDGSLFIFNNIAVFSQDEFTFQVIMHYLFKYKHGNDWQSSYSKALCKSLGKYNNRFFIDSEENIESILSKNRAPFFVTPKLSNERIKAQQGAFALFSTPVEKLTKDNQNKIRKFLLPQKSLFKSFKPTQTILIPKEEKEKMLFDLDCLGINKTTLFPELEAHATDIVRRIRLANKIINKNRK